MQTVRKKETIETSNSEVSDQSHGHVLGSEFSNKHLHFGNIKLRFYTCVYSSSTSTLRPV